MRARQLVNRLLQAPVDRSRKVSVTQVWSPSPPQCPEGWDVGPPHFVGVGSQRAGTSWWFKLLSEHPSVSTAPGSHKEVHFFDRFWASGMPDGAADAYYRHFPREPGTVVGEWTPRYMHDFWTPALLKSLAPDARILVMVRDPVERYRSGLSHETMKPEAPAPLLLADDAFARGLYHQQLERVLAHFDTSQVLLLQHEACLAQPAAELRRTQRFIGLDPDDDPPHNLAEKVNPSPVDKAQLPPAHRRSLVEAYRRDTSRLLAEFPEIDGDLWPNMRGVV